MGREEAVVLGAGFAGLGTAAVLEQKGIPSLVIERSPSVGASWRGRYDSLRLNTPRTMSTLPRYRMPRDYGRWPRRDDLVRYLEDYARKLDIRVQCETEAERIDRSGDGWLVETSQGPIEARWVVVATGYDHDPKIPDWPGREGFTGELTHAASYRNADPFRGRDVLVVAPGNTGSEVACELVRNGAARVRTAMRTPPNVFTREWLGLPTNYLAALNDRAPLWLADQGGYLLQRLIHGDLSEHGIPRSPVGYATNVQKRYVAPVIDAGFVDALKKGEIEIVAAVEAFDGDGVVLADGTRIQPDVVIAATGYRRGLEPLVGHLGVLDEDDQVSYNGVPCNPRTPGLYFIGYRTLLSGQIRLMRRDARKIARAVARERTRAPAPDRAPQPVASGT